MTHKITPWAKFDLSLCILFFTLSDGRCRGRKRREEREVEKERAKTAVPSRTQRLAVNDFSLPGIRKDIQPLALTLSVHSTGPSGVHFSLLLLQFFFFLSLSLFPSFSFLPFSGWHCTKSKSALLAAGGLLKEKDTAKREKKEKIRKREREKAS